MKANNKLMACCLTATMIAALVACSPEIDSENLAGNVESDEAAEALFSWNIESECSVCHTAEADSAADAACLIFANHADIACVECHADAETLTEAHADVTLGDADTPDRLRKTEVPDDACISCHPDGNDPAATADVDACTDLNGLTVNPHDLPVTEQHQGIVCGDCHTMHERTTTEEAAQKLCISCHHHEEYECFTCHN